MMKRRWMPLFAADDAGVAGASGEPEENGAEAASNADAAKGDQGSGEQPKTYSQAEVDKLKESWEKGKAKDLDAAKKSGISEAERLAKMTEAERMAEENKRLIEENEKLKSGAQQRALKDEASKMLTENNLPSGFADFLIGKDAEETSANVKQMKTAFDTAVQAAVEDRLKGKTPGGGSGSAGAKESAESVIASRIRRGI